MAPSDLQLLEGTPLSADCVHTHLVHWPTLWVGGLLALIGQAPTWTTPLLQLTHSSGNCADDTLLPGQASCSHSSAAGQ
jgi:hypothetical protein